MFSDHRTNILITCLIMFQEGATGCFWTQDKKSDVENLARSTGFIIKPWLLMYMFCVILYHSHFLLGEIPGIFWQQVPTANIRTNYTIDSRSNCGFLTSSLYLYTTYIKYKTFMWYMHELCLQNLIPYILVLPFFWGHVSMPRQFHLPLVQLWHLYGSLYMLLQTHILK